MAHTPAPDPTLTVEELTDLQNDVVNELKDAREQRDLIPGIPDELVRVRAQRDSDGHISELVNRGHYQLGMSKLELAALLDLSRQGLDNILKKAATGPRKSTVPQEVADRLKQQVADLRAQLAEEKAQWKAVQREERAVWKEQQSDERTARKAIEREVRALRRMLTKARNALQWDDTADDEVPENPEDKTGRTASDVAARQRELAVGSSEWD